MDEYNEMMDQYEKDRRDQTHTWVCKDAILYTLDTMKLVYDSPVATRILTAAADLINGLPEHRFSLMDEIKEQDMTGELPYEQ